MCPDWAGKCGLILRPDAKKVDLKHVLYVPEFSSKLVSVSKLCDDGYKVEFDAFQAIIKKDGKAVGTGKRSENLYIVMTGEKAKVAKMTAGGASGLYLWHQRIAHADNNAIARMANFNAAEGINLTAKAQGDVCEPCMEGMVTNGPMPLRKNLCLTPGAAIHTAVAYIYVPSLGGAKYFVTFLDAAAGKISASPIVRKNEARSRLSYGRRSCASSCGRRTPACSFWSSIIAVYRWRRRICWCGGARRA